MDGEGPKKQEYIQGFHPPKRDEMMQETPTQTRTYAYIYIYIHIDGWGFTGYHRVPLVGGDKGNKQGKSSVLFVCLALMFFLLFSGGGGLQNDTPIIYIYMI